MEDELRDLQLHLKVASRTVTSRKLRRESVNTNPETGRGSVVEHLPGSGFNL